MQLRGHVLALAAAVCLSAVGAPADSLAQTAPAVQSGPTLGAVLAEVLSSDPQVRAARSSLGVAQSRARQASSKYWPSAGVSGNFGRSTDRELNADVNRSTERLDGVLRWNLYNGGSDRAEIAATEREIGSARFELDRARSEVADRIAEAWLDAQKLRAVAAASRRRLHDVAILTNQVASQGSAGKASDADVLQATSLLSETQVSHELALAESQAALARLETLTGKVLQGLVPVGFPTLEVPDSIVHPAVRAARERAEAAAARQRKLAEALAPRLDFEVRQNLSDRTDPAPTTALKRGASVAMTWDVPLGGETFARQDEARLRAEAARAEAERIDLMLRADLAALRQRERAATEAVDRTRTQVDQTRALVRAASAQFEAGRRSVQQLIQSREAQFSAEQRFSEAQARLQQLRMRQWSAAGALLAVVGVEPGLMHVAAVLAPVMDLPPAAALPLQAPPTAVVSVAPMAPATAATPLNEPTQAAVAPAAGTFALQLPADIQNGIFERMVGWLAAWKARDVDTYLGFYGDRFIPGKGLTRVQWEAQRRRVLGQKGSIEIEIVEPRYDIKGDVVGVVYEQHYRSPAFQDKVRKRVEWARDGSTWRIVRESVL